MSYEKYPCVYIVASKKYGTLYTGVTSNLVKRIYEHRNKLCSGFTQKYACKFLVFYELHHEMEFAILREKQIKKGSRKKKIQLIESMNPNWVDLYMSICGF
ncbi:MAG: GIY-YIG nuclease family protein [Alphaproteobacteria bacterium]|nr:MAG: GIY-YIG nuclease family protein [Alphaproteobacteria bacterium]